MSLERVRVQETRGPRTRERRPETQRPSTLVDSLSPQREAPTTASTTETSPGVATMEVPQTELSAEELIEAAATPHSILRATQFHEFLDWILGSGGPIIPVFSERRRLASSG